MAGGTWMTQNKVRPGVYVRFDSEAGPMGTMGERGVVALPLKLSWGPARQVLELPAGEATFELLGYEVTDKALLLVREAFKRAKTVLLYRLNEGTKAQATHKEWKAFARCGGVRGNDIVLVVRPNVLDDTKMDVITKVAGREVDLQTVAQAEELKANAWVEFEGSGSLEAIAGLPLTGGEDGAATNEDHMNFLDALAVQDFHTVALPSEDKTLASVYTAFIKRMREEEGKKIQAVLPNYPLADSEGVISVKNGVKLADGTVLGSAEACVWVAAATAAAAMNESLTYSTYEDAIDADVRLTNRQVEAALEAGEFVFVHQRGRAVVEQDINSFTSHTPDKGRVFSKNRVVRVLDGIANDMKQLFETSYVGKVNNNGDGRQLFRGECIAYLDQLVRLSAIQPFDAQTDVQVTPGDTSDSIVIQLAVQPVDAVEKIYMKVKVK
ncbi:phage tail sheath family protein [Paenibacillus melissococcoides]|uniref:Phage tail sheath family protein n=1 Tax=Paenibacillus melissococcoides TaxID=2912268 RepID=A0ABM9G3D4_9BACL|nr:MULTISPECIES: phage tail sheath family protein [Paenibacillus]MEB9893219.1 phage tail sheath family protein [Bacillus cereus]CAH8246110.1 phage tail sheath family protein [Paenibacillus melissococcoides]CAH8713001.1 phage tail sheath family protein [Paenibacillus melissococcoides]CAH8713735.1 phage tail sheath family protein [Paenibacillus melissococcoides]GIO78688.1 hypothetical protein J6TS7_22980 [Paenibacillus dendritiformis]